MIKIIVRLLEEEEEDGLMYNSNVFRIFSTNSSPSVVMNRFFDWIRLEKCIISSFRIESQYDAHNVLRFQDSAVDEYCAHVAGNHYKAFTWKAVNRAVVAAVRGLETVRSIINRLLRAKNFGENSNKPFSVCCIEGKNDCSSETDSDRSLERLKPNRIRTGHIYRV